VFRDVEYARVSLPSGNQLIKVVTDEHRQPALLTHQQGGSVPAVQKSDTVSDLRVPCWRRRFR
jgi:hypothetical protein